MVLAWERPYRNPEILGSVIDSGTVAVQGSSVDGRMRTMRQRRQRRQRQSVQRNAHATFLPEVFENPDALDIGRREKSHLSFGRGIHYCLGASLAVLEARVAFAALPGPIRLDPSGDRAAAP